MAKVNSDSITKLGEENKIQVQANEKEIKVLKEDNIDRENEINDLRAKDKLDHTKLTTKLGVQESQIQKVEAVNKDQNTGLAKLGNEDKAEEADHKALKKTVGDLEKTQTVDQKTDITTHNALKA